MICPSGHLTAKAHQNYDPSVLSQRYSLKSDLSGFEPDVQALFKQFLCDDSEKFMKSLSMEKIISLKEAIARDQEATTFVLNYTKEVEGSKKVLDKIKNDGGANV